MGIINEKIKILNELKLKYTNLKGTKNKQKTYKDQIEEKNQLTRTIKIRNINLKG